MNPYLREDINEYINEYHSKHWGDIYTNIVMKNLRECTKILKSDLSRYTCREGDIKRCERYRCHGRKVCIDSRFWNFCSNVTDSLTESIDVDLYVRESNGDWCLLTIEIWYY